MLIDRASLLEILSANLNIIRVLKKYIYSKELDDTYKNELNLAYYKALLAIILLSTDDYNSIARQIFGGFSMLSKFFKGMHVTAVEERRIFKCARRLGIKFKSLDDRWFEADFKLIAERFFGSIKINETLDYINNLNSVQKDLVYRNLWYVSKPTLDKYSTVQKIETQNSEIRSLVIKVA
jgi:hypothetical protein